MGGTDDRFNEFNKTEQDLIMTTSTTSSLAVQSIGGSNYQSIINAIQGGGVTAKMASVPVGGNSGRTNYQMALFDSSGNMIPASALGNIYPNGDGTYTIQIGAGDGGALNITTQGDASGKLAPIQSNSQVSYTGGSSGSVLGSLASAAKPIALPLAIAAIAATNPELLPSFGTDTLGADVIPASTATGATSAAAADEASGLTDLGLGQAGTEAASGALPAASGATASGALPVASATGATAGDLAIATDPVAANIAAGMTPADTATAAESGATDTEALGNYSLSSGSSGTGLNVAQGSGTNLFDTTAANPATGLQNGLGVQAPGSASVASMGGAQGITMPSSYGVLGQDGVTVAGTGGLPVNTLTGSTLGSQAATTLTGQETAQLAVPATGLGTNALTGQTLGTALSNVDTGVNTSAIANSTLPAGATSNTTASSGGNTSVNITSGGTTGGSSSGPWNQPLTPGVSVIGASKAPAMTDPLVGLLGNISSSYTSPNSYINNILSKEYQSQFGASGYAKGGKVERDLEHLNKLDPEYIEIIKERLKADKSHPNYGGLPLFRTGGLGKHVRGPGTGQSDDIPAMLADGEYVFDADTVSALGDGSNKAGAEMLDKMREAIREHKRSAPINKIPPKAKNPLSYLKDGNRK